MVGASGPPVVPPRPGAHLHRRAPSGAGSACPARVCRHIGSTAWHGTAPSRQGSPVGMARWGNRVWNVEPTVPCCAVLRCAAPWMLTCSWQSRYCRWSPVHGSSSAELQHSISRVSVGVSVTIRIKAAPCSPVTPWRLLVGLGCSNWAGSDAQMRAEPQCPIWGCVPHLLLWTAKFETFYLPHSSHSKTILNHRVGWCPGAEGF